MGNERTYFCAYHSYLEAMEPLNDAEKGRLFTACLIYSMTGEAPQLSGNERFIFPSMRGQIDRDKEKYRNHQKSQSENGKKGGRPKNPTKANESEKTHGFFEKAKKAKENEKEKEKENITPPIIPPKGEKDVFSSYAGEDLELLSALRDFESMRKKIKKPMSDRSKEMLLKRLDELADTGSGKIDLLNNAIYHCWQSVYPQEGGNYGTDAAAGHQGDGGKGPQYGTVL